jgi:sugar lactone lactonase YvrE
MNSHQVTDQEVFLFKEDFLMNERMVVTLPEDGGLPDGMTTDEEGMLWIAQWDGWQVSRWNPSTGQLLEVVRVPVAGVTSCAFGGENLDTLYITTARVGIDPDDLLKQPLVGGVFALKTKTRGIPTFSYNG